MRNLEAAKQIVGGRRWRSLLLSETTIAEGTGPALDAVLADTAPHLTPAEQRDLHAKSAGPAVSIDFAALPDTTASLAY